MHRTVFVVRVVNLIRARATIGMRNPHDQVQAHQFLKLLRNGLAFREARIQISMETAKLTVIIITASYSFLSPYPLPSINIVFLN